jgi:predicted phage terminase large subunit-like protein
LTGCLAAYDAANEDFYILDYVHEQFGPGKIEALVRRTAEEDGFDVSIGIEREPGAAGKILIEHYAQNVLRDFKVEEINTGGRAKLIRAQPFLAAAEDGHVYYYQNPTWNKTFVSEFETFPSSSRNIHDDMIDTAGEAFTKLTGKKALSATWGREADSIAKAVNVRAESKGRSYNTRTYKKANNVAANIAVPRVRGATWGR